MYVWGKKNIYQSKIWLRNVINIVTYHSDGVRGPDGADDGGRVGLAQSLGHDEIGEIEVRDDEPREKQYRGQGQEQKVQLQEHAKVQNTAEQLFHFRVPFLKTETKNIQLILLAIQRFRVVLFDYHYYYLFFIRNSEISYARIAMRFSIRAVHLRK